MKYKNLSICIVLGLFFFVEVSSDFSFSLGDDQVYFYMGKLVEMGYTPYKDFFYAHPPLQLYLYALVFKFVDYQLHTFHAFFILLTIVNSYLLFLLVKRVFNEKVALLSSALFLFTPTTLFNASFEYGLTIGLALFLSALLAKNRELKLILFVLSVFYRFHFIFLILGYYIYTLLTEGIVQR